MNTSYSSQQKLDFGRPEQPVIDFHMHSTFSDGSHSPSELANLLYANQITDWSLTDHDTLNGLHESWHASQALNLNFFAGVEISARWQPAPARKAVDIHIVGLGMTQLNHLQSILLCQQEQRAIRAKKIADRLQHILKMECWEPLLAMVDGDAGRLTRTHFARWLVENKVVTRPQQAFDRFLSQGKGAYVAIESLGVAGAIDAIRQSGGVAVLAHPGSYQLTGNVLKRLIQEFSVQGGQAIELPSDRDPPTFREMIEKVAVSHQLYASYGSDYHGPHKSWCKLGMVPRVSEVLPSVYDVVQPLKASAFSKPNHF